LAPVLWAYLGIRILQDRPISHRKLAKEAPSPLERALDDLQRSVRECPYSPRGVDIRERPAATVTQ
jgi:hypothetical protein